MWYRLKNKREKTNVKKNIRLLILLFGAIRNIPNKAECAYIKNNCDQSTSSYLCTLCGKHLPSDELPTSNMFKKGIRENLIIFLLFMDRFRAKTIEDDKYINQIPNNLHVFVTNQKNKQLQDRLFNGILPLKKDRANLYKCVVTSNFQHILQIKKKYILLPMPPPRWGLLSYLFTLLKVWCVNIFYQKTEMIVSAGEWIYVDTICNFIRQNHVLFESFLVKYYKEHSWLSDLYAVTK